MKKILGDLWLVILLIVGASAILLLSDLDQRKKAIDKADLPIIAMMQIASTPLLDNHQAGMISRLKAKGFIAADESNLLRYNAQGDITTANTIAREIVNGPCDIIFSSSTVALQTISSANSSMKKKLN